MRLFTVWREEVQTCACRDASGTDGLCGEAIVSLFCIVFFSFRHHYIRSPDTNPCP